MLLVGRTGPALSALRPPIPSNCRNVIPRAARWVKSERARVVRANPLQSGRSRRSASAAHPTLKKRCASVAAAYSNLVEHSTEKVSPRCYAKRWF